MTTDAIALALLVVIAFVALPALIIAMVAVTRGWSPGPTWNRDMWANSVIHHVIGALFIPLNVLFLVTTAMSGIISAIPVVGLLWILIASLVWQLFLWPLVALAWLWSKSPWPARALVGVIGIPWAVLGWIAVSVFGAMSPDPEDRMGHKVKQSLCQQWPYAMKDPATGQPFLQVLQQAEGVSFFNAVFLFNDQLIRYQLGYQ